MKQKTAEKKSQFQILLYEVSDNIQALAMAFGERLALDSCIEQLKTIKDQGVRV